MNRNIEQELGMVQEIHPMFSKIGDEEVLHPEKISEMLGLSTETVRRWCRKGKLSNYNFGGKYVIIGKDFKEFMQSARSIAKTGSGFLN